MSDQSRSGTAREVWALILELLGRGLLCVLVMVLQLWFFELFLL